VLSTSIGFTIAIVCLLQLPFLKQRHPNKMQGSKHAGGVSVKRAQHRLHLTAFGAGMNRAICQFSCYHYF